MRLAPTSRFSGVLIAAASGLAMAHAAFAQDGAAPTSAVSESRRVLIDRELGAQPIRLISLSGDSITYEDEQGRRRQATVGGFVALAPAALPHGASASHDAASRRAGSSRGYVDLIDGQRFPGEHAPTGGDGEAVVWTHPAFGRLTIPLDNVAQVVLDAGVHRKLRAAASAPAPGDPGAPGVPAETSSQDFLYLTNGDMLAGFILGLGDPIEIEIDGSTVTLRPDRVAGARLSNPNEPLGGLVIWLADGSVAVVTSIETNAGGDISVRLPGGQSADFPLESVRAVAFAAGRLRPLASIAPESQTPVGRRTLLDPLRILAPAADRAPAELNAPDVELPGPMTARWKLPAGARRFGAVADLPLDALPWGDCELVVAVDGVESLRTRLSQDNPRHEFSIPLTSTPASSGGAGVSGARELTITIEPGASGPVNDRVILRRPMILVDSPEG